MRMQITLTVAEAKRVIAKAIATLPEVERALRDGKILLKGGTTISAVCEELVGVPLWISGRITPSGTKTSWSKAKTHPHSLLIVKGRVEKRFKITDSLEEAVLGLEKDDVIVIGANAIDVYGNAAIMVGAPLGGLPGRIFCGMMAEGVSVIIAAGLEKLIPGTIKEAVLAAGRKKVDRSFGMAVGLVPLVGNVITEKEAIEKLADVKCRVIGKGGIDGAEGSTTLLIEGSESGIKKIETVKQTLKESKTSGIRESLVECGTGCPRCKGPHIHLACIYR